MTIPGFKLQVVNGGLRVVRDPNAEPSWEYLPTVKDHVLRSGDFRAVLHLIEEPKDSLLDNVWSITVYEKFEIVSRTRVNCKERFSLEFMKNMSKSLLNATTASEP